MVNSTDNSFDDSPRRLDNPGPYWPLSTDEVLRSLVRQKRLTILVGAPGSGKSRSLNALARDAFSECGRKSVYLDASRLEAAEAIQELRAKTSEGIPSLWIIDGVKSWTPEWSRAVEEELKARPDVNAAASCRTCLVPEVTPLVSRPWTTANCAVRPSGSRWQFYFAEGFLNQELGRRAVSASGSAAHLRFVRLGAWACDGLPGAMLEFADAAQEMGLAEAAAALEQGSLEPPKAWKEALDRLSMPARTAFADACGILEGISPTDLCAVMGPSVLPWIAEWRAAGLLHPFSEPNRLQVMQCARRAALMGQPALLDDSRRRLYQWMESSGLFASLQEADSERHAEAWQWAFSRAHLVLAAFHSEAKARTPGVGVRLFELWPLFEAAGLSDEILPVCREAGRRGKATAADEAGADFAAALAHWNLGDQTLARELLESVALAQNPASQALRTLAHCQLSALAASSRQEIAEKAYCQQAQRLRLTLPQADRRVEAALAIWQASLALRENELEKAQNRLDEAEAYGAGSPMGLQHASWLALRVACAANAEQAKHWEARQAGYWKDRGWSRHMPAALVARSHALLRQGLDDEAKACRRMAVALCDRHGWGASPFVADQALADWHSAGQDDDPGHRIDLLYAAAQKLAELK